MVVVLLNSMFGLFDIFCDYFYKSYYKQIIFRRVVCTKKYCSVNINIKKNICKYIKQSTYFGGVCEDHYDVMYLRLRYYGGCIIKYMDYSAIKNRNIVNLAVKNNGYAIIYTNGLYSDDKEIILNTVKNNGIMLNHASNNLKNDIDVVMEAVKNNGYALQNVGNTLINNKDVVMAAVKQNGYSIKFAGPFIRDDIEIITAAVENKGSSLRYVKPRFITKELALKAVSNDGYALSNAGDFCKDRDVVMAAVKQNGFCLMFAPRYLVNDKEILMEAVKTFPGCINKVTSLKLLEDDDIMYSVLSIDESFYYKYPERMRDRCCAIKLVKLNKYIIKHFSINLQNDPIIKFLYKHGHTIKKIGTRLRVFLVFKKIYDIVRYKPGNSGYKEALDNFNNYKDIHL